MQNKTLIVVGTLSLIALLFGGVIIYGFSILADWKGQEHSLRQDLAQEDVRLKRLGILKSGFELVKQDEVQLQGYFFQDSEEDWLRFVTSMEEVARSSGVKTVTSAPDYVSGKPFLVDMTITGSLEQCYRFMKLLESFPARLSLSKFALQSEGNPKDMKSDSKWNGSISIELESIRSK
jgi:hypothetical protein